ncbi:alginate lyase family protein [Gillisia hiemivivida]|nr:alginate lyase family protein [Gillisia hiemivivida]
MKPETVVPLKFQSGILYPNTYLGSQRFSFLNIEKSFSNIDWNFAENGKLWTYNLNYFEFLNQEKITKEQGLNLIWDYISKKEILKDGLEPYPISLRGINWVKFLAHNEIKNEEINDCLFQDYSRLSENLEYHLLANHLLENGFSLLFGAYYFKNEAFYSKAKQIIVGELNEQILNDGAHYELSPMYHQIILHRVLDCINLVGENSWKRNELLSLLMTKAEKMLGFLEEISFKNGEIPKLNDAANGIAPNTKELKHFAESLGIKASKIELSDSGYRKFEINKLEILMDVGQIAPTYQPGHSHADSLQFLMSYNDQPIIVDTGISTYEKNERRQLERSTASHNTVTINDLNSSEVWGGFRVARRAKVTIQKESANSIEASHNGYAKQAIVHKRTFSKIENYFEVIEEIISDTNIEAKGHLHFHPDVEIEISGNKIFLNNYLQIEFLENFKFEIQDYKFAERFNKLIAAKKLVYSFTNNAEISIKPLSTY